MSNEEIKKFKELAKKVRLACWESRCEDCPFMVYDGTFLCMFDGNIPSDWRLDDKEDEDE